MKARSVLALGALYLLAAARFTAPAALRGELIGQPHTDLWNSLWGAHHLWGQVLNRQPLTRAPDLNFPQGGAVWVADPLGAIAVGALAAPLGDSLAWALSCTAQLALAGLVAHGFAYERLQRAGAPHAGLRAAIAGASFMACGTLLSGLHNGASEGLSAALPALAAWMGWRCARPAGPGRLDRLAPVIQAAAILGAALRGPYSGALALGFSLLAATAPGGARAPRRLGGIVLGISAALPYAVALDAQAGGAGALLGIKRGAVLDQTRRSIGPADLRAYLAPLDFRAPDFTKLGRFGERYLHSPYLGWSTTLAAVVGGGGAGRRWLWAAGLGALVLSLGPVLLWSGEPLVFGDGRALPLPYFALEGLPGFRHLTLLWRIGLGLSLALALLAAEVPNLSRRGLSALLCLVLIEPHLLSPAGRAVPSTPAARSAAIEALRGAPPGAAFVYPLSPGTPALYDQITHQQPISVGLNFPSNATADQLWATIAAQDGQPSELSRRAIAQAAQRLGLRYLIIYNDADAVPDEHTRLVRRAEALFPALGGAAGDAPGAIRVRALW